MKKVLTAVVVLAMVLAIEPPSAIADDKDLDSPSLTPAKALSSKTSFHTYRVIDAFRYSTRLISISGKDFRWENRSLIHDLEWLLFKALEANGAAHAALRLQRDDRAIKLARRQLETAERAAANAERVVVILAAKAATLCSERAQAALAKARAEKIETYKGDIPSIASLRRRVGYVEMESRNAATAATKTKKIAASLSLSTPSSSIIFAIGPTHSIRPVQQAVLNAEAASRAEYWAWYRANELANIIADDAD